MKTKAKKFSHKLLALFMALVMGITCFSGVLTSYAASSDTEYLDENIEYNQLAWRLMSDEQTATAVLDYMDEDLLPNTLAPLVENLLIQYLGNGIDYTVIKASYDQNTRILKLDVSLWPVANVHVQPAIKLRSVNEVIETIGVISDLLTNSDASDLLPTLKYAHLDAMKGMTRENSTSCEIVSALFGILRQISFNAGSDHTKSNVQNDILGEVLRGDFVLVTDTIKNALNTFLKIDLDLYTMLGDLLGMEAGYQSNMVYNIVKTLLLDKSGFFTPAEVENYKSNPASFNFDKILLDKLSTELLQKINVLVTYDSAYGTGDFDEDNNEIYTIDNSINRKKEITALTDKGMTYEAACKELGYDPNLRYSTEVYYNDKGEVTSDFTGNILLFVYGDQKLSLNADDTLMSFGYRALKIAWKTVLSGTLDLIHVNNNVNRGHGSNFDNQFYYWAQTHIKWNYENVAANYSQANLNAWAEDVWNTDESYNAESPADFLENVKNTFEYDRTSLETSDGSWEDIDATTLFGKLRYSPMADYGFNMQTGPINLYFLQTGSKFLDEFFNKSYDSYGSITAGFNDCLVAAVKDIFVTSDNVIGSLPEMATTSSSNPTEIARTLVGNAVKVIEYTADATDANILKAFRTNHPGVALSESNLEEAMMPMLAACIGQVNLGDAPLAELIHPEDWNACDDAEGLAYLALREYLSYSLPENDYTVLVNVDKENGGYIGGTIDATLEGTIMPMARDALGYIMEPLVPLFDSNGNPWKAENSKVDDTSTTVFTLLNSVVYYYADDMQLKTGKTMGVASLLGVCDNNGNSLVTDSNDIWTNLDTIINCLMPLLGELQYGQKGAKINTYDLIWNDVVKGFLEIGNLDAETGLGGVGSFLERLLTIFNAPAITQEKVLNTVYDFLKELLNGFFNPRYDNQKFGQFIPDRKSDTPFDDLLQKEVLAGTDTQYNPGVVQKLIIRLAEITGFGGYGENKLHGFPDSALRGMTFAVTSVLTFFPSIFPALGESGLRTPGLHFSPEYVTGAEEAANGTTLTFKNEINGLNPAYVDNGEVKQLQRYTININSARYYDAADPEGISIDIPEWSNLLLEPGQTISTPVDTVYTGASGDDTTTWIAEVNYDVVYVDGTAIEDIYNTVDCDNYKNLVATSYQYINTKPSWQQSVYPDGTNLNSTLAPTSQGTNDDGYGNKISATGEFNGNFTMQYPNHILLTTSEVDKANKYTLNFISKNKDKGMDGIYNFDEATVFDTITNSNVTVNSTNPKVAFDENGNALNYDLLDYSVDGGQTWNRNSETLSEGSKDIAYYTYHRGFTGEALNTVITNLTDDEKAGFKTRTHVVYTLDELKENEMVKAVTKDAEGNITAVYIKNGKTLQYSNGLGVIKYTTEPYKFDVTLGMFSYQGPCEGTYVKTAKVTCGQGSNYMNFLAVYDKDLVQPGVYDFAVTGYAGGNTAPANIQFVIIDDSNKALLQNAYDNYIAEIGKYSPRDFTDYDGTSSAAFDAAKNSAAEALATLSTPLTVDSMGTINASYAAGIEKLDAAAKALNEKLDTTLATQMVQSISVAREKLNENNFDITTFNTMKKAAKAAEAEYTLDITYTDKDGVAQSKNVTYEQYKGYRDNKDITDLQYKVNTKLSSAEVTEYVRNFNIYVHLMLERGYMGSQIEAEILCAGGAAYNTFEVTPATVDANGNITSNAVVKNTTIAAPQFGKYVDGVLVNEGDITYPAVLWNNYVNRLADAVAIAQLGNGSYAHKEQAKFVVGADDYDANNTTCYRADSLLQVAEIALENTYVVDMQATEGGSVQMTYGEDATAETFTNVAKVAIPWKDDVTIAPVADAGYELEALTINGEAVELDENGQYTGKITTDSVVAATFTGGAVADTRKVSASIVIATNNLGTTNNVPVYGDYTVSIYDGDTLVAQNTFAMSADNNTFSFDLAPGTYTAVIESQYAMTREDITIIVGDADITGPAIPIIACNFNGDEYINGDDALIVYGAIGTSNECYNMNGDEYINGDDALLVYSCGSGAINLTPVIIK